MDGSAKICWQESTCGPLTCPGCATESKTLSPILNYELEQYARRTGKRVTFSKEARDRFLKFAGSHDAVWNGNFRDLNGAVVRMATLCAGGRITIEVANEEIDRLRRAVG